MYGNPGLRLLKIVNQLRQCKCGVVNSMRPLAPPLCGCVCLVYRHYFRANLLVSVLVNNILRQCPSWVNT